MFAKFPSGDFPLKGEERSGGPVEVNNEQIKALIDYDRHGSTRDIAEKLDVSDTCVQNRLSTKRSLMHNFRECELTRRLGLWDMLVKRNANDPFLKEWPPKMKSGLCTTTF